MVIVDSELVPTMREALAILRAQNGQIPVVIEAQDEAFVAADGAIGQYSYEDFIATGDPMFEVTSP